MKSQLSISDQNFLEGLREIFVTKQEQESNLCPKCKRNLKYSSAISCPALLDGCEEHQGYYCPYCNYVKYGV